ncbi:hypothetical protein Ancab_032257 [Ancistrocladus abbreviatus]
MAFYPKFSLVLLAFAMLTLTFYPSCSYSLDPMFPMFMPSSSPATSDINKKVNMSIYYETLCPASKEFFIHELSELFKGNLISIVNLNMIPWGNARIAAGNFICQRSLTRFTTIYMLLSDYMATISQHGEEECYLNTVHICAITQMFKEPVKEFRFLKCALQKDKGWRSCVSKKEADSIEQCAKGPLGFLLELLCAKRTAGLKPPHEFVPWVVVNDLPLKENYEDFVSYICNAYKGRNPPKACKGKGKLVRQGNYGKSEHTCKRGRRVDDSRETMAPSLELVL